jgi:pyridoxamine 5'-phosphate oxidase
MITNHPDNPFELFKTWFEEAQACEVNDPNAMCLSTVNEVGQPSSRMVLMKDCDYKRGVFIFYTNFESRKAKDILTNPHVALCFHWKSLKKQIRIEGVAYTASEEDADLYFSTRALGSQIGAWASKQSRELKSRDKLENEVAAVAKKLGDAPIPRPPHWGGFCVQPTAVEFWLERPFRLHDRLLYTPSAFEENGWEIKRLYP